MKIIINAEYQMIKSQFSFKNLKNEILLVLHKWEIMKA